MVAIIIKAPNYQATIDALRRMVPDYIQPARLAATVAVAEDIKARVQQPGQKPTYPIKWDTIKQRKAFFATKGFGGGIPHIRTGSYQRGWTVEERPPDGVKLFNEDPATLFVGGNAIGQVFSGIHVGRWPNFAQVGGKEIKRLPDLHAKATQDAITEFLTERG